MGYRSFGQEYRVSERCCEHEKQKNIIIFIENDIVAKTKNISENGFFISIKTDSLNIAIDQIIKLSWIENQEKIFKIAIVRNIKNNGFGVELFDEDLLEKMQKMYH
jgi:hypothetical protein